MAFSLSSSPEGGTQFTIGVGGEKPTKPVAGEPGGFPTRTLLIIGGLVAAAVVLIVFVK